MFCDRGIADFDTYYIKGVLNMKKGWKTAIACFMVYVLSFGAAAGVMGNEPMEQEAANEEDTLSIKAISSRPDYLVKEHNGVVAVFFDGDTKPMIETDISISGLRQNDRELIEQGIALQSYNEVLGLLEDFGS